MQYVLPKYPAEDVNKAGRAVTAWETIGQASVDPSELTHSYEVLSNWRAAHHRPLNTFYMALKGRAQRLDTAALTSQRIKRIESIAAKLAREHKMKLSQMQDIGGCRAVLNQINSVEALRDIYVNGRFTHEIRSSKDYIESPKSSGYRGVHLIYAYKLREPSPHQGLKVEIQLRTRLQHTWATAVEAAGTFTNQALKSSQGSEDWQRFFALVSSWFAQTEDRTGVPNTPISSVELADEIKDLARRLHVAGVLSAYSGTIQGLSHLRRAKYYLMELDPVTRETSVEAFSASQMEKANAAYTAKERAVPEGSGRQVVLVSVESLQALRQAYPNYFLDTEEFVRRVEEIAPTVS